MRCSSARGRRCSRVGQIDVETPTKLATRQRALLEEFRETETGDECPASQGFFAKLKGVFAGE